MEIKKPTDEEVLEIIRKFREGGFKNDEENEDKLEYINMAYPRIAVLIFWDKRNLTPEQILEEAKKIKPILL